MTPHFEVWAYDPLGHGCTRVWPDEFLTVEALAADLAAWLRETGLVGTPLFGHSLGGQVLLHLADRFPDLVSRLVLCAPTGRSDAPPALRQLRRLLLDACYERPASLLRVLRSYGQVGLQRVWHLLQSGRLDDSLELAPRIHVPVLILVGGHVNVIRRQALVKLELALPQARRIPLADGGHALHDLCAGQVTAQMLAFLVDEVNFTKRDGPEESRAHIPTLAG